jgi:hypothetical protein
VTGGAERAAKFPGGRISFRAKIRRFRPVIGIHILSIFTYRLLLSVQSNWRSLCRHKKVFALALEDKFDDIKKLIDVGKEKGYLTYNEVNDLLPNDLHSPEDLDDLLTTIGTQGIDILEGPKLPSAALDKKYETEVEAGEDVELDLTPGALEKTNDPVRMCVKWARFRCSPAKAKSKLPSGSNAVSFAF